MRQFLDVGTGLPVPDNTHEIAQRIAPASRVFYVDNDPIVMTHSRALTQGTREGRTGYLEADVREPETILGSPELHAVLDLTEPVALLLVAVLHFVHDDEQAVDVVHRLLGALPPGSCLVVSNMTLDLATPEILAKHEELLAAGKTDARARDRAGFSRFFEGLELADPGIVVVSDWRPTRPATERPTAQAVSIYGAVARKP
jgi:hypothetical protein